MHLDPASGKPCKPADTNRRVRPGGGVASLPGLLGMMVVECIHVPGTRNGRLQRG